jgi:hypothetical protein
MPWLETAPMEQRALSKNLYRANVHAAFFRLMNSVFVAA